MVKENETPDPVSENEAQSVAPKEALDINLDLNKFFLPAGRKPEEPRTVARKPQDKRAVAKKPQDTRAVAKKPQAVDKTGQSDVALSGDQIAALLTVTWEVGALTWNGWKAFQKTRGEKKAAQQVLEALDSIENQVKPIVEEKAKPPELPRPRFLSRHLVAERRNSYRANRLIQLTAEHARIRSELLQLIHGNNPLALAGNTRVAAECLQRADLELARDDADLSAAFNYTSLADRAIVWLYPDSIVKLRCKSVLFRLRVLLPKHQFQTIERHIQQAVDSKDPESSDEARQALSDGLEALYRLDEEGYVEEDLQIKRLRRVYWYIAAVLASVIIASPLLVNADLSSANVTSTSSAPTVSGWPVPPPIHLPDVLKVYFPVVAIGIMGAIGGTLSGLLTTRDSRPKLSTYRTDMIKLSLKPLVGALAAVTLYALLSWNVIPGIQVISGGMFLALALLAGFSERYFLRLLRTVGEETGEADLKQPVEEVR